VDLRFIGAAAWEKGINPNIRFFDPGDGAENTCWLDALQPPVILSLKLEK